jgi:hypothetical protein
MRLAGGIEIDFVDDPKNGSLVQHMEMVAGLLQQAGAAPQNGNGRSVEVTLRLLSNDQWVMLRSRRLRAVAEPSLLDRLEDLLGEGRVRVLPDAGPRRQN